MTIDGNKRDLLRQMQTMDMRHAIILTTASACEELTAHKP